MGQRDECEICYHEWLDCWCEPRCGACNRTRSGMLQRGVRFWFVQDDDDEGVQSWQCERCFDWDPKSPCLKSDKYGYTQWMSLKREKLLKNAPSGTCKLGSQSFASGASSSRKKKAR